MRKILIACLMTFTLTASAQMKVSDAPKEVEIGEFKQLGTSYAEIVKYGDVCVFTYRDEKYEKIDSYSSFKFRISDLDGLYSLFTDFEGVEKDSEKRVELEDGGILFFRYKKMMGKMYAEVFHTNRAGIMGKIRWMNEKQLKTLFGKS